MKVQSATAIVNVDQFQEAALITFADGTCALYSGAVLRTFLNLAQLVVEPPPHRGPASMSPPLQMDGSRPIQRWKSPPGDRRRLNEAEQRSE